MFNTIGVYGKYNDPTVKDAVNLLTRHLEGQQLNVYLGSTTSREISDDLSNLVVDESAIDKLDLAIVIGGDGTMLHVARIMAPHDVPIVGINLGHLGFLTDIALQDMLPEIDRIIDGQYVIEERLLLRLDVIHNGDIIHSSVALNEFVIGRNLHEKLLNWQCYIDGVFLTSARSDGVIIATPTGSTAYALSAGGPIIQPTLNAVVVVPISPHTLSNRPIVLPASSRLEFRLDKSNMKASHVSGDGLISFQPEGNEVLRVQPAEKCVKMVKPDNHDYFAMLRGKLGWGERG